MIHRKARARTGVAVEPQEQRRIGFIRNVGAVPILNELIFSRFGEDNMIAFTLQQVFQFLRNLPRGSDLRKGFALAAFANLGRVVWVYANSVIRVLGET